MSSTKAGAVLGAGGVKSGSTTEVKVSRYFAGKAPDWVEESDEDDLLEQTLKNSRSNERGRAAAQRSAANSAAAASGDRRLRRLGQNDRAEAMSDRRRRVMQAEVVEGDEDSDEDEAPRRRGREPAEAVVEEEDSSDDEGDDEREARRARMRARAAQEEEEMLDVQEEDNEEEEEESESEYETETESEDDMFGVRAIAKPVFVRKEERESIAERERKEAEEEERYAEREKRMELRRTETRQLVATEITKEADASAATDTNDEWDKMPDDNDDVDEAAEYEAWKIRELRRVKRDHDELAAEAAAKADIERRRNMTEAQIIAEDKAAFKNTKTGMKEQKWKYLQKYYHRGAFFQDVTEEGMAEPLYQRDIGGATLEDNFDKEAMPKVMQVKNFGKMSQVKWTHLMDNDTTRTKDGKSASLAYESGYVNQKMMARRKTAGSLMERPSRKKVKL